MRVSELDGQVAIVTGAGGGIGGGIVASLSEAGAAVVLTDYDGERLAAAEQAALEHAEAARIAAIEADVTSKADVTRLAAETIERFGRIDVLVNNAGVLRVGPSLEISEEEWNLVLSSNLTSAFLCSQAVLPHMIENGRGAIVNITSVAADAYTTNHVHYAASKAGMIALTRDLGYEMAPHGVRINGVSPSAVLSRMNQEGLAPATRESLEKAVPLGRWGEPSDVGDAVVFLASERAAFIVGENLPVAGGSDLCIIPQP
jgi:NAD(P)-dependent dehydrogenase (short-subunit alcohol dehydrogenase family)